LSQTAYNIRSTQEQVAITRRHHPLAGELLTVLQELNGVLVLQLKDGSSLRVPRIWTNADGPVAPQSLDGNEIFSVNSLRELMVIVAASGPRP
jgi:hypothetical protein